MTPASKTFPSERISPALFGTARKPSVSSMDLALALGSARWNKTIMAYAREAASAGIADGWAIGNFAPVRMKNGAATRMREIYMTAAGADAAIERMAAARQNKEQKADIEALRKAIDGAFSDLAAKAARNHQPLLVECESNDKARAEEILFGPRNASEEKAIPADATPDPAPKPCSCGTAPVPRKSYQIERAQETAELIDIFHANGIDNGNEVLVAISLIYGRSTGDIWNELNGDM